MRTPPIVLADLDATLERRWFGDEPVLRDPIPALEPPPRRGDHWSEPERFIDPAAVAVLLPYHRSRSLVLMTERPEGLHERTVKRLAAAGFDGVPLHHVTLGEHPAYGKRRVARAVRPAITIEDDLRIAEFLARYGYETLLLDDRHNRGPIRSVNLMRVARAGLGRVLTLRLAPQVDMALDPELVPA
jgi:hypothetical protein